MTLGILPAFNLDLGKQAFSQSPSLFEVTLYEVLWKMWPVSDTHRLERGSILLFCSRSFLNNLLLSFSSPQDDFFFSAGSLFLHYFNGYVFALMCQWKWKIQ